MPKSSRTRRTPISLSASSVAVALADSSTRTLSVTSRRRLTGSRPVRARISAHRVGQVAVGHLAGREVDRDVERPLVGAQLVPAERLAAGRLLHPAADRLDQAAVLGDRDELAGVEQAALGMVPAHQRLEADDLAAAQGDHRLVVQLELVAVERVAQLALGLEPAHGAGPHLGVEDLAAPAPALLRPVHRRVGVADQQLGVDRLAARGPGDGDADAGGDEVVGAAHRVGLREGAGDAVGDRQRLVLVGEPVDEDAELVAAEAGDDVAGPQVGAQPRAPPPAAARRRRGGRCCR